MTWNKGKKFTKETLERTIQIIEKEEQLGMHEATARKHAKRYLIHKNGNVCSICETKEWQGQPVPLVCDHITGDSLDNRINNFRLVCCNCDAQLPTFKSKNKGKGRAYDRKYMNKRNNGDVAESGLLQLT
jgi:hypothetical protein